MSTTEKDGQKKTKSRWDSGVTPYAEMGYWDPDYEPKDTDVLCAFRITPQDALDAIEVPVVAASLMDMDRRLDRPPHVLRALPGQGLQR